MANNTNTASKESYASWQEGVADSLSDKLGISYNDAQGIIDASEFYMAQAWGKGMNEEQTADFIDKKSRSMANGGGVGKENFDMVKSQNKAISHHTKELNTQLNKGKNTPAWVVSKVSRASNDLSDVTHYLDGETMANGGGVEKVGKVMHEYKEGNLHSGRTGKVVTDRKQAIAIALSEAGLSKKMVNGGGVGEENEVLSFFNNIDYSKLPPAFSDYIKKEVLTDDDLQYLSPREPIFLEIKSKVEGYSNKPTTQTTTQAPIETGVSEEKKKVMQEIADLEGLKDLVSGDELNKINKELDDLNGLLPIL